MEGRRRQAACARTPPERQHVVGAHCETSRRLAWLDGLSAVASL